MLGSMVITVSQLNSYIKSMFESDENVKNIFVMGEISNLTNHYQSGHIYFSLKENNNIIRSVIFSRNATRLKFPLKNGINIIARGTVSSYEVNGQYQLYIEDLQPAGLGSYYMILEELKSKLLSKGFFDESNKKELPSYPKKIGVITSFTGAVIHDIENVLKRRYPIAGLEVYPAQVQGEGAPDQIVRALNYASNNSDVDVLIIARGGGSIEDLWAFNNEEVVRAIYECKIPTISAIGHETDFTLCDLVSDLRVPTPSAAAELAVPDIYDLRIKLDEIRKKLNLIIYKKLDNYKQRYEYLIEKMAVNSPENKLSDLNLLLDDYRNRLELSFKSILDNKSKSLRFLEEKLYILDPLSSLNRGYSILMSNGKIIKSLKEVKDGKDVKIVLGDDEFICDINNIRRIEK